MGRAGIMTRLVRAGLARPRPVAYALAAVVVMGTAIRGYRDEARRALELQERQEAVIPVAGPAAKPSRVVSFSDGCTASRCHGAISGAAATHEPVAEGACEACHAPDEGGHSYPLLRPRDEICSSCHATGERHSFQHKAMSDDGCLACHDPHGGKTADLLVADTTGATCVRCHPKTEGRTIHKPYAAGKCVDCHDPHGAEDRHLLLSGEGDEHCARCHSSIAQAVKTGSHTHRDVKGECNACHAAHASDAPGLLLSQARELCVACHENIAEAVAGARVSHDPVLKDHQCVTCHEPHASENARMLRKDQPTICLSCHDKDVTASDGRRIPALAATLASSPVVHGAITHGDCSACHSVHGSTHERLLKEINPNVLSGAYDVRNYALCFSCHNEQLATVSAATQFRDGDRNLHEVHMRSGDKSRGCADCHAVHASDLPRLIATNARYGGSDWAMPMGFVVRIDGGSCAPGCHEPMGYSRNVGGARKLPNGEKR